MTKRERSPSTRISPERSAACNQDVAFGCHNFVVAHPSQQARVGRLDLPKRRPVLRFNLGPLLREQPDGTTIENGEVMHTWGPSLKRVRSTPRKSRPLGEPTVDLGPIHCQLRIGLGTWWPLLTAGSQLS